MNNLKLCAFCNSVAVYTDSEGFPTNEETDWCTCSDYKCMDDGEFMTVKKWQSRPSETALEKKLEQAEAKIQRFETAINQEIGRLEDQQQMIFRGGPNTIPARRSLYHILSIGRG